MRVAMQLEALDLGASGAGGLEDLTQGADYAPSSLGYARLALGHFAVLVGVAQVDFRGPDSLTPVGGLTQRARLLGGEFFALAAELGAERATPALGSVELAGLAREFSLE